MAFGFRDVGDEHRLQFLAAASRGDRSARRIPHRRRQPVAEDDAVHFLRDRVVDHHRLPCGILAAVEHLQPHAECGGLGSLPPPGYAAKKSPLEKYRTSGQLRLLRLVERRRHSWRLRTRAPVRRPKPPCGTRPGRGTGERAPSEQKAYEGLSLRFARRTSTMRKTIASVHQKRGAP